ncbi:MAG: winged helix-turn-helix transcriptional regulator [Anaerolineae bacterium]|jgi:predicted ArsR family transcriptional regulator|nr:winged helix-turn-helix transcriptional regulator [Anaerolineae bacterium]MBT3713573.1 winged helix-turn-helix transcriptional regulator [Anaerolineae bacterium]MBT4310198.1 winged helix-turn-helix transcriptional regulator [Anaerolineae bacterium]MBT4460171.1 winged helix-turn-helix transcriptional regulator [Anaerolineae bacterium]MBT4843181.1 winged helix-turn-helix transcriptional regulator [Anaerolineae bacterium]
MAKTRDEILQALLRKPRSTINDLAEAVGINPISVRHHLNNLQAGGLIISEEERHGVGRPRLVYTLTEEGSEKFPTRYLQLTSRLLSQLKETLPNPMVKELFSQVAMNLAEEYTDQLENLNVEERLDMIKELLAQEGFTVEWEKSGDQYLIHEISCPYHKVGQNHPEICSMDQTIISQMLAVPAEQVQCILSGDERCTYVVEPTNLLEMDKSK